MRLAVVGGKLQGIEAAYLAGEAGYEVVLIDRRPDRPAAGLAAEVHVFDLTTDPARAREVLLSCDAVLPACEDDRALAFLSSFVPRLGVPLLFDPDAYAVTQSKLRSNALFERLDVPRPAAWPACGFPAMVKPSVGSGSSQVQLVWSEPELVPARARLAASGADAVVEEYRPGAVAVGRHGVVRRRDGDPRADLARIRRRLGLQAGGGAGRAGGQGPGVAGRRLRRDRRLGSGRARRRRPAPRRRRRATRGAGRGRPARRDGRRGR